VSEAEIGRMAMAVSTTAPYPYTKPLLAKIPYVVADGHYVWEHRGTLPAITGPTDTAWTQIEIILTGISELAKRKTYACGEGFSTPARVELLWCGDNRDFRGLVIFDSQGRLIVHVTNALLGYSGSGSYLSKQILTLLGISKRMFEEIQYAVWNMSYVVILTRQKHEVYEGVDTAYPTLEVEPEWRWWTARASMQSIIN
jgi:hypothetical protein